MEKQRRGCAALSTPEVTGRTIFLGVAKTKSSSEHPDLRRFANPHSKFAGIPHNSVFIILYGLPLDSTQINNKLSAQR
jgi:hypothetical protein